jgi:hypothetical protein
VEFHCVGQHNQVKLWHTYLWSFLLGFGRARAVSTKFNKWSWKLHPDYLVRIEMTLCNAIFLICL